MLLDFNSQRKNLIKDNSLVYDKGGDPGLRNIRKNKIILCDIREYPQA